jgi:signal-induced proliferation-associated 1 like protein 3
LPKLAPPPAAAPDEVSLGTLLLKPEGERLFEGGVLVPVEGGLTLGPAPAGGSCVTVVVGMVGGMVPDPVAPLVCATMLVASVAVESEPLEVELPEPDDDPPAAAGVAVPPAQTTPGAVSGSWSVVPLAPEVSVLWLPSPDPSVLWLPSPDEGSVTQIPAMPEPLVSSPPSPDPVVSSPEPVVSVPEPVVSVPEPVVSVPEPVVSVPEPVVSVPEPVVSVPDPLESGTLLSWPLLVVLPVPVGAVVVSVGAPLVSWLPPVSWLPLVSPLEQLEPSALDPSVVQVVTGVSEPASAPSVPLAAPAVDVSVESKLWVEAKRMRLLPWVLAALWAAAVGAAAGWAAALWVAGAWAAAAGCVAAGGAATITVWGALTGCD